jgi:hypothetical protein
LSLSTTEAPYSISILSCLFKEFNKLPVNLQK